MIRQFLLILSFSLLFIMSGFADEVTQQQAAAEKKELSFTSQATAIDLQNAELSLQEVQQTITNTRESLRDNQEQLDELTATAVVNDPNGAFKEAILKAKIQNQVDLLALNKIREDRLREIIRLFSAQLTLEQQQLETASLRVKNNAAILHETQMKLAINQLGSEQNYWLNQIDSLNKTLQITAGKASPDEYNAILQNIFIAEENSSITQFKINILHLSTALSNITSNISNISSPTELGDQQVALDLVITDLEHNNDVLSKKIELLQNRLVSMQGVTDPNSERQMSIFIAQYQSLLSEVADLLKSAKEQDGKAANLLAKALAKRQALPGFDAVAWQSIGKSIAGLVVAGGQLINHVFYDVVSSLKQSDASKKVTLIFLPFFGMFVFSLLRIGVEKVQKILSPMPDNLLHRFLNVLLKIILSHLWFVILWVVLMIFLALVPTTRQAIDLVFHLGNATLIFSIARMTAHILLYENAENRNGDDIKLYHRLFFMFSFGFAIALCMVLTKNLSSNYELRDLFERAFMLFILVTALMLLKAWQIIPELIIASLHAQRQYFTITIKLLSVLFPLIILSNAVIGLVGYVELAWVVSMYEGLFLLVAAGYLIVRGLLNDLVQFIASQLVRIHSGWMYSQAFLMPLALWLHIGLFLISAYLLLYLYGLNHQSFMIDYFYKALHFPLLRMSNSVLTLWLLIKAGIIGAIFFWATKWAREFSYRKLYRNIEDIGARHSLAMFTQYGVCLLGCIVTLKVMQIDLTTLAYIVSGFALGIGFGLRDLANNFVSGLLILIERPVCRGDTVTIGEYDGKVMNVGIRATTILSGDNREILVPNSEIFSKIFTNWTHRDDVVRCETSVKVRWQEDPHKLQSIMKEAILATTNVLAKPDPDVLLKGMNDGLLEFEIKFYIDYKVTDSRSGMKSAVLFNIWDRFAALGVHPPYPTQELYLHHEKNV